MSVLSAWRVGKDGEAEDKEVNYLLYQEVWCLNPSWYLGGRWGVALDA